MPISSFIDHVLKRKKTAIIAILVSYVPIQALLLFVTNNDTFLSFSAVPILLAGWLLGAKFAIAMAPLVWICGGAAKAFTLGLQSYTEALIACFPLSVFATLGFLLGRVAELKRTVKGQLEALQTASEEQRTLKQQLDNSEKMRAIGQLAGGFAHDVNNQLSCIMGSAEMLKQEGLKFEDVSYYADSIKAVTKRAGDLTKQVLYFSHKAKDRAVLIDVHTIIRNVVSLLQHSIDKRISIHLHFRAEDAAIVGEPSQLENVILNLSLNARDAMPKGGDLTFATDVVSLDTTQHGLIPSQLEPGRYLRVTVSDTGIGIDEDSKKHIFEPFYSTKDTGRGMGLASVYSIVHSHSGAIDFSTEPDRETTFSVYLPLPRDKQAYQSEVELPDTPIKGQGRILLVDDDVLFLDITTQMLASLGYETTSFTDGNQALGYFKENWRDIHLVVLDLIMPGITGADVFDAMREISPHIKVILSSGSAAHGQAQRLLDEGALGFLQKPFSKAELSNTIAGTLKI